MIEEFKYDFCGIKGQRELTEHFATADVAEAFLNDPYGPDGTPKPPIVCATEADSDAALTMQMFKHLSGTPVLFADVRHYHQDLGVWDLCNSGEHATYFAGRSTDPACEPAADRVPAARLLLSRRRRRGLPHRRPGAGDACPLDPPRRPLRDDSRAGRVRDFGAKNHEIAAISQDNWPHAFARFDCTWRRSSRNFHCNHIHGVYGDWVAELEQMCSGARHRLPRAPLSATEQ